MLSLKPLHYIYRYVLRNKPDEWTDQMRVKTYEGFKSFVELLTSLEVHNKYK